MKVYTIPKQHPDYLDLLNDLVDRTDSKYATNQSPYVRIHDGASLGGLCSAYVGLVRIKTVMNAEKDHSYRGNKTKKSSQEG